jgi:hypothetical protein
MIANEPYRGFTPAVIESKGKQVVKEIVAPGDLSEHRADIGLFLFARTECELVIGHLLQKYRFVSKRFAQSHRSAMSGTQREISKFAKKIFLRKERLKKKQNLLKPYISSVCIVIKIMTVSHYFIIETLTSACRSGFLMIKILG